MSETLGKGNPDVVSELGQDIKELRIPSDEQVLEELDEFMKVCDIRMRASRQLKFPEQQWTAYYTGSYGIGLTRQLLETGFVDTQEWWSRLHPHGCNDEFELRAYQNACSKLSELLTGTRESNQD